MTEQYRGWEYARRGDYHRNIDPNWSYTPTYIRKNEFVRRKVCNLGKEVRILDAGCGEGVLVEEFTSRGFRIEGLDINYESDYVRRGSILSLPYYEEAFDAVLLLDVFEHLSFVEQPVALSEVCRVLKQGGKLIASIPNLAHWNSRFRMLFFGELDRTDIDINHIGERPFRENRILLRKAGFSIEQIKGVTLTIPLIYRRVICRYPARFRWLHDLLEPIARPSLALLDIFICRKT